MHRSGQLSPLSTLCGLLDGQVEVAKLSESIHSQIFRVLKGARKCWWVITVASKRKRKVADRGHRTRHRGSRPGRLFRVQIQTTRRDFLRDFLMRLRPHSRLNPPLPRLESTSIEKCKNSPLLRSTHVLYLLGGPSKLCIYHTLLQRSIRLR